MRIVHSWILIIERWQHVKTCFDENETKQRIYVKFSFRLFSYLKPETQERLEMYEGTKFERRGVRISEVGVGDSPKLQVRI